MNGRLFLALVTLTTFFLSGVVWAQGMELKAHASVSGSNIHYAPGWTYAFVVDTDASVHPGPPAAAEIVLPPPGVSFTGLDRNGTTRTMHFHGNSSAKAHFRPGNTPALHTNVSGTLTNGFYNPDNPPFFDSTWNPDNPEIDWDGVPDTFDAYANASFTEILQWGGTATNYSAVYQFAIHGVVTGDAIGYAVILVETEGKQDFFSLPVDGPGQYAFTWRSRGFPAGHNYPQPLKVTFFSAFDPRLEQLPDGVDVSGRYDFGATISLEAIGVETEAGGPVHEEWSVTAASGTTYDIIVDERLFSDGFEEPLQTRGQAAAAGAQPMACKQLIDATGGREIKSRLVRCAAAIR